MENLSKSVISKLEEDKISLNLNKYITKFRSIIRSKKKLDSHNFTILKKYVAGPIFQELIEKLGKLNNTECIVIGRAIMKTKLINSEQMILYLLQKGGNIAIILITCILIKKVKINCKQEIIDFIKSWINSDKIELMHLQLILILHRNYNGLEDEEILEFCRKSKHPICKEIISKEDKQ
ncbi:hypothetical protein TCON_0512 [Astathelohania contejeani]|uniref:Uncharacterized protein n=1 Tax=Astathelohania contejeani TaxID=164912 RepID=A0ABQ7I1L5_9MICR|nr:hypothetical protein TCON_0512 [Thelohania contejeani]